MKKIVDMRADTLQDNVCRFAASGPLLTQSLIDKGSSLAIVHTRLKVLSRSTRNTVAALAYRSGTELVDETTGEVFDYRHKAVAGVELLLPDDAPQAWKDLQSLIQKDKQTGVQKLSNIAEAHEKRVDAQVYREYEFALPRELTDDENKTLTREFVQDQICGLGMAAKVNFHFDVDEEGNRFPHAHVVMLTRRLEHNSNALGLSRLKEREWNRKDLAKELRFQFCEYANFHFKQKGIDITLDPRSYAEQGIDLIPQVKIGKNVSEMAARLSKSGKTSPDRMPDRMKEYTEVKLSNQFTIIKNPQVVIDEITSKQTTFTERDIHKVLNRYIDDRDLHQRLVGDIKSLKSVIELTPANASHKQGLYTTKALIQREQSFLSQLTDSQSKRGHAVKAALVTKSIETTNQELSLKHNSTLSSDQIEALKAMVSDDRLVFVEGYAGSGKTTVVETAATIWKQSGYNVVGLTPTNKAKEGLKSAGINAYTVHSFLESYSTNRQQFHKNTVLVLDEAGMVDLKRYTGLLKAVEDLGVKLVSLGDRGQLTPVEAGCPFTMASQHYDFTKLTTIIRQKETWQKEATQAFGNQDGLKGLQSYFEHGNIKFVESTDSEDKRANAKSELIHDWVAFRKGNPEKTACILAHTNQDVADLNDQVRAHLRTTGEITGKEFTYVIDQMKEGKFGNTRTISEERSFAVGDQIVFTGTNKGIGVHNGSLGRITSLNKSKIHVEVDNKVVSFSPNLFKNFDLGWAMTVHKSQGATVDEGFVLGSRGLYANLTYVALTRHRDNARLYLSQTEFKSVGKAFEWLTRKGDDHALSNVLSLDQMQALTKHNQSVVSDVVASAKQMVSAITYVGRRKLNDWSGIEVRTYKSDAEGLVSSYLEAEGLGKAQCASKLLEEVKTQDDMGIRDIRSALQAADLHPNGLELKLLDLVAKEAVPSKTSLQAALTFIDTVKELSDFRTQQGNDSYHRLAAFHYRCSQSLGVMQETFQKYQPLKKLGYEAEGIVDTVVSIAKEHKVSVLAQLHAAESQDKTAALSVYDSIKPSVLTTLNTMNSEKEWGLSDSQVKGFADVVMQASLDKVALNAKSFLTREDYNKKTSLEQAKTDAGIALMKTSLGDEIASLEDRWAVTLTDTFTNHQKAEGLLSTYQSSDGLEKAKRAHEITEIMDGDSSLRPHVRGVFNEAGLYRNSVELALYSRLHEVTESLEASNKEALIGKVEAFEIAFAARRDEWNSKVEAVVVSEELLEAHSVAMDKVFANFEAYKLNGYLTEKDILSLERVGLNLRERKEDDRFAGLKSELESLNERKEFGLSEDHIVGLTNDLCKLVHVKENINAKIFDSICASGDFAGYRHLLETQEKTATALANSDIGDHLIESPGKWAEILQKSLIEDESLDSTIEDEFCEKTDNQSSQKLRFAQVVINEITNKKTTFTERDIHQVLTRYVDDRELHQRLVGEIKSLNSVIEFSIGDISHKNSLYTTKESIQNEQSFLSKLTDLQSQSGHSVNENLVTQEIETTNQKLATKHNSALSPDQIDALKAMVSDDRLVFVEGYAGSGKTTVVETAANIWKASGYEVVGLAPTNKAKEGLKGAGINAYTVHSFLKSYSNNRQQFHKNTVLVLDEAGMVDLKRYTSLLNAVDDLGVKLVSLGDRGQLAPVEAGRPFMMASKHYEFTKLTSIIRQKESWQKDATQAFGNQDGLKGLQSYFEQGNIKFADKTESEDKRASAKSELIKDWVAHRTENPTKTACILAYTNKDVADLNDQVRSHLKATGDITGKEVTYLIEQMKEGKFGNTTTVSEERSFAVGDQIVFTGTNKEIGVHNGSFGRITSLSESELNVEVDKKTISFDPNEFKTFDLGWAMTIHKSQGATVDEGFVLGSRGLYANLTYVALTRHKDNARLYLSKNEFTNSQSGLSWLTRTSDEIIVSNIMTPDQVVDVLEHGKTFIRDDRVSQTQTVTSDVGIEQRSSASKGHQESVDQRETNLSKTKSPRDLSPRMDRHEFTRFVDKINTSIDGETLAKDLLRSYGLNAKSSNASSLRFGRKGSLSVKTDGLNANTWKDFETDEGGTLLKLIQREHNCDFKSAIAYAAPYCRGPIRSEIDQYLDGKSIDKASVEAIPQKDKEEAREEHLEQQRQKIADVSKLVDKSVPIQGSPAETYLRQERNIQGELPDSLRYVPAKTQFTYNGEQKTITSGAMISIAKSPEGEVKAIQLTYLTTDGRRARNKDGKAFAKLTYGSNKGAFVTVQQGVHNEPFIMAEGVETALSVKAVGVKGTVVCSLGIGNYKNIITDQKHVIIAADWDGSTDMPTYKAAEAVKVQVESQGGKAQIILPVSSLEASKEKVDFNDVLQTKGVASLKELLNNQAHHLLRDTDKPLTPEQTNEPTLTRDQEKTASHQYGIATENAPQMGKGESVEKTPEQDPQEFLKQNILTYFKHELSLEENAGFPAKRILDQASQDPLETLKWWQEECDGSPFKGGDQSSLNQNATEPTKDISDIFAEKIQKLDDYINLLSGRDGYEKSLAYKESERSELLDSANDTMLQKLQTKYPEIAERVEQQRITNHQREHSRGHDISI